VVDESNPRTLPGKLGDPVQSGDMLVGTALQLVSRLRDHIERLDSGIAYAADDLAVVLRVLLCHGKGNDVLQRLYGACGLARKELTLSAPPQIDQEVHFSVGSIPTWEPMASSHGAVATLFTKWPNVPLLVVKVSGQRKTYTWGKFIEDYAHKWGGAHLDTRVPPTLQMVDHHAVGDLVLSHYLIRMAAVQVWLLAQEAFGFYYRNRLPREFPQEGRVTARYAAHGGITTDPRDTRPKGHLQWFCRTSEVVAFLWYVDDDSRDNVMRLSLGSAPFDVYYTSERPSGTGREDALQFIGSRQPIWRSLATIGRDQEMTMPVKGVVKPFTK
jgi:hypothetical protein